MKRLDYILCLLFGALALISRLPFVEKFQSHWDGAQYSIAIVRYSFEQQTPAPPGYPFYIGLGKLFYFFFHDPHASIVAVNVLGSIIGAVTVYIVGLKMFNRFTGVTAAILFLTGSTFYYFGISPHAYILLVTTTALLAYSVYRIYFQKNQEGLFLGLILGISIGIRPQEVIQIGLLFLLGFLSLSTKEKLKAAIIFIIVTFVWFIPIVQIIGFKEYFVLSSTFAKTAIFSQSIKQHVDLMIKGFLLSFGIAGGFLFYYLSKRKKIKKLLKKHRRILIFYSAWILPGFFYNLLIRSEGQGYQMSYLVALLFLISYAIWKSTKRKKYLYYSALTCIAVFNLFWFFYDRDPTFTKPYRPVSFHYSDLRKNDVKVGAKVNFVQDHFDPKETLIVSTEVMWRPYSYYLKNYPFVVLFRLDNTAIPYSYGRIDSVNWNMTWTTDKRFTVSIPKNTKTVVFMDDAAPTWLKHTVSKTHKLPGNSSISTISVKTGEILRYDYHTIILKK